VADVRGHKLYPGNPCPFLDNGCSIYEDRPEDPCRKFVCQWLQDETIPDEMQPHLSNIILTKRTVRGVDYIKAEPAGDNLSTKVLSWFVIWGLGKNICWTCNGLDHYFGSVDFVSAMSDEKDAMLEDNGDQKSEMA